MHFYNTIGTRAGSAEAAALSARLAEWHDAMVAHERRLRDRRPGGACGDDCPHGEARELWAEAKATFGERARELAFLRAKAA